jgi:hypothetical protein
MAGENTLEITREESIGAAVINVKTIVARAKQMSEQIARQLRLLLTSGSSATGVTGDDVKTALGADAVRQIETMLAQLDALAR